MLQKRRLDGFKNLLVYKKSERLWDLCQELLDEIKPFNHKTIISLADQMERSCRSVKQNIIEGWKRNTTKEYIQFLGFSIASLAELEEDGRDIAKGRYGEMGVRGVTGSMSDINSYLDSLPFYPLPPFLPLSVVFVLKCRELSMLLHKLQQSLEQKIVQEGVLTVTEKFQIRQRQEQEGQRWLDEYIRGQRQAGAIVTEDNNVE